MKNTYQGTNILIIVLTLALVVCGILLTFTYKVPTELEVKTGIVSEFEFREDTWWDVIFGYTQPSSFRVWFEDDSFFEATGICYDNIDHSFFEKLQKGDEITITYSDNRIYAIEYDGNHYLSLGSVSADFEKNAGYARIGGPIIIVLSLMIGAILITVNYRKHHR